MLEIIEKADRMVKSAEYKPLMIKLGKVNSEKEFTDILMKMSAKEKKELEEAVIGLAYYNNISLEEQKFINNYNNHCMKKSAEDKMEWLNNGYLKNMLLMKIMEYRQSENKDIAINGMPIVDLHDSLIQKYNCLITEMTSRDLNNLEKEFIINFFDMCSDCFAIEKFDNDDIMQDVVKYFDKYPFDNLETAMNRKMYILYTLSKELVKYKCNSLIRFNGFDSKDLKFMAFFQKLDDNTGLITINRMNSIFLGSEEDFIEKLYTIYHELGHFNQEFGIYNYTDEEQKLIDIEREVLKKNYDFYLRYHDNFFLEQDADIFATKILKNNIHHDKVDSTLSDILSHRKIIDQGLFMNLLLNEYNIQEQKDLSSDSKKS